MSMRESISNFFRYLFLIAFVIGVALGGRYYYNRTKAPATGEVAPSASENPTTESSVPTAPAVVLPSQRLAPVMQTTLPALFSPIDGKPFELGAEFSALEKEVRQGGRPEKMRASWNTAGALCREIRALAVERNAVTVALDQGPVTLAKSAAPHSKADVNDTEAKRKFFQNSARQRWATGTPQRKKKIEVLYRRLLADESAAR